MGLLELIAILLIFCWGFGTFGPYHAGGAIHILLVVALVIIVIRLVQGRRPLP
jgi:uncharacterized membrane protein YtjA (UPF0391 family)